MKNFIFVVALGLPCVAEAQSLAAQVAEVMVGNLAETTCEQFLLDMREVSDFYTSNSPTTGDEMKDDVIIIKGAIYSAFMDGFSLGSGLSGRAGAEQLVSRCSDNPAQLLGNL